MSSSDVDPVDTRMPVWTAMSGLFLDTELLHADRERIATVLAASPYSEHELEEILRFEVTPVLKWNLLSVAGEWSGFDETWLRGRLSQRIDQRPWLNFGVHRMVRAPWREIIQRVAALRGR